MNNPAHGGTYRIQSVTEDNALNVHQSKLADGTTVINWPVQESENENWKVKQIGVATYRFETAIEGNSGQLLDENVVLNSANIRQPTGSGSQEWFLEPVAYIIRNSQTGRVLQAAEQSNVIKTIPDPPPGDRSVWWTFNPV